MGFSRLITARYSFFRFGNCAQIVQVLQGWQSPQAQSNGGFSILSLQKSFSFLRMTLLTYTEDMLEDFKTCLAFMLQEYSILQIILLCTLITNSILDCSTFRSCSLFDFHSLKQKLYFKLDYKFGIFNYEL